MSAKSWQGKALLIVNGLSVVTMAMLLYYAWGADPRALVLVKFTSETASSWLTFFGILFASMLVFLGLIYTVQDELFGDLVANKPNLERLSYQVILQLGVSCLALVVSSQPQPTVYGWRRMLIMLAVLTGIQGTIKAAFVFIYFYSMDYLQERYCRCIKFRHNYLTPHTKRTNLVKR